MSAKRALIVDDSRSARTFLTRILERYDLQVDGAASAEEAIEYLDHERPDVIFMDHLMPGMDGFQALTVIKNDPRTAAIPVMMYTSQEGELYLGQARALGALGVLPKQTKARDVSRALEQLQLLDQRRHANAASAASPRAAPAVPIAAAPAAAMPPALAVEPAAGELRVAAGLSPEMRAQLDALLQAHGVELRRFVADTLAAHTGQILSEMRALMEVAGDAAAVPGAAPPALPVASGAGRAVLWLSLAAAAVAVVAGMLWYRAAYGPATRLSVPVIASAAAARPTAAPAAPVLPAMVRAAPVLIEAVPFGEPPLALARVAAVRALLERLAAAGLRGIVEIRSYPGRYCMLGQGGAAALPAGDARYAQCARIGNPMAQRDLAAQESAEFSGMLAARPRRGHGAIDVQFASGNAGEVLTPYPRISPALSAGEWNRAAAANNRIEVYTHPLP